MAEVTITVGAATGATVPALPRRIAEATYTAEVPDPSTGARATSAATTVQDVVRVVLDADAGATIVLPDVVPGSPIVLRFLSGTGATRLERTLDAPDGGRLAVRLEEPDLAALGAAELTAEPVPPRVQRRCRLVPINAVSVAFETAQLRVAVVPRSEWTTLGLAEVLRMPSPQTTSVEARPESHQELGSLAWAPVHLGVDGGFEIALDQQPGAMWLWWLVDGSNVALGAVDDDLGREVARTLALPLPPFAAPASGRPSPPTGVPMDVTETELVDNPGIFTEDPGAFCRPFSNPERILGERAFHVVLRAEQPSLSSEPTRHTPWFPLLDFDPPPLVDPDRSPGRAATGVRAVIDRARAAVAPSSTPRIPLGQAVQRGVSVVRPALPDAYLDLLRRLHRGRSEIDATHPIDWEGDASQYQAATVARGHILEFRLRWRSNGYSLGTVAKTLTLAPRQVKRVQKIEWQRLEKSRRDERTQLRDQVADQVSRERTYADSVEASLDEWARGSSESSTGSAAGGFGFATAGFVIGGGGGYSQSNSSSSSSGGRDTRAAEEQRLRDTIRRFADSLRRLDSMVVTEVSQEESVTGTTEIVRNANYAHSLTVVYYQILRHLKLETTFAAVRECLFVPFAIKPFTVARAYRWRDAIRGCLRDPRYATALTYLRDVMTGFVGSSVPPGRRADQQIRFVRGSMTVSLGIERPPGAFEGSFDELPWLPLRPFLPIPALAMHARLREMIESRRDRTFQEEYAPRIAAGWADTLTVSAGGAALHADFTLATRYQFNGAVRIDFTIAVPQSQVLTRQMLSSIRVSATRPLTPGSVANLTALSYTYDTDSFRRSVSVPVGTGDLITVQTGAVEPTGATAYQTPDAWERENERDEMVKAVQALVGHLNEHVEHYHKAIWWAMDRDRLFMLIDGAYIPGTNGVSVASVVERDPIAIVGNCLVFRVSAGAFLGIDGLTTPAELYGWYARQQGHTEPMHVALPTDGLNAQTIMDDCVSLEEHRGDLDWVLDDSEPELGEIDPSLLMTRRTEPVSLAATPFPQTIISLQNAPEAPAPSGLAGALQAVQNAGAFRDMAGLAGTQANAAAGLQTAANLASSFGQQAASLRLAEMAADAQRTKDANQKLGTIRKAKDDQLVPPEKAAEAAGKVIESLHEPPTTPAGVGSGVGSAIGRLLEAASATPGSEVTASPDAVKVSLGQQGNGGGGQALDAFGMVSSVTSSVLSNLPGVDLYRDWMQKVASFKSAAVQAARAELARWAGRPESDAAVLPFLEAYARAGGSANPAGWAAEAAANNRAWSAGFISFVVEQAERAAGIPGDPFGRSTLHSNYIAAAKRNRSEKNMANPFWLFRLDEVQPEPGDFLCKNRPGLNTLTFDNIQAGDFSHVDVVTEVTATRLLAMGGNRTGDTVVEAEVPRTGGHVTATSAGLAAGPYFAILRVRTSPIEGLLSA